MKTLFAWTTALTLLIASASTLNATTVRIDIDERGTGSGTVLVDGTILTAAHVTREAGTLIATTETGKATELEVIWEDNDFDLALTKPKGDFKVPGREIDCSELKVGEDLRAEGNPLGFDFVTTYGKASTTRHKSLVSKTLKWMDVQVVSVPVAAGMSGGGMMDTQNRVRGVIVGAWGGISPIGIIVPASRVCKLIEENRVN